jgi:hypothetical protein
MDTQRIKPILNFVLIFALAFSWLGGTPVAASPLLEAPASSSLSVATLLNSDGTLNLRPGASGKLDLAGWNVTLDAERGPVFAPAAPTAGSWSALGTGISGGVVNALAIRGTDVIVAGNFTNAQTPCTSGCNDIARWNGTTWSALGTGFSGVAVYALAISGTDVIVGGDFTNAQSPCTSGCNDIARWNGTTWSALGTGFSGVAVYALAVSGTSVIAGGDFTNAQSPCTSGCNDIARWNGTAWSALGTGFSGVAIYALAVSGTSVIAGGDFTNAQSPCTSGCNDIARWNGTTWSALGTGFSGTAVYALAVSGTDVIVGGDFTNAQSPCTSGCNDIARWNGTAWSALGTGMSGTAVYALAISGTSVIAGGDFTNAQSPCTSGCNDIALWNGTTWSALGTGFSGVAVRALTISGTDVIAGGDFTNAQSPCTSGCNRIARYVFAPTLTGIAPNSGPIAGGVTVILTGTNLTGGSVTFGGAAATCTVNSVTQITCASPAHAAGAVNVVVTTPGGTATTVGGFTYVAAPLVTNIAPSSGPTSGGTSVVLTGTNLTGGSVTFGGSAATCTVNSATKITCATPAHAAGAVNVVVTTPGGTTTTVGGFTYVSAPLVTNIVPSSGPTSGGTSVVLTGTNLTGGSVTFGGTAATCTVNSATKITCATPAHVAGAVNVVVTTPGGTSTTVGGFTYVAAPLVTNIAPSSGPTSGGTSVVLTGTNLTGGSVTFGGSAATCTVNSATKITCATPAHAAGAVNVVVTTPGGTATTVGGFTYVSAGPTLTSILPNSGPVTGGTGVVLTGTNFTGASVTFNGSAVTCTVNSATQITCTTPAHAAGTVDVSIITPNGTITALGAFTYVSAAPTLTSILPNSGPVTGGTSVVLAGTNLTGGSVTFGGTTATCTVNSATKITCTTPAHAAGAVNVVVTTPGGSATTVGGFWYVFQYAIPIVNK